MCCRPSAVRAGFKRGQGFKQAVATPSAGGINARNKRCKRAGEREEEGEPAKACEAAAAAAELAGGGREAGRAKSWSGASGTPRGERRSSKGLPNAFSVLLLTRFSHTISTAFQRFTFLCCSPGGRANERPGENEKTRNRKRVKRERKKGNTFAIFNYSAEKRRKIFLQPLFRFNYRGRE